MEIKTWTEFMPEYGIRRNLVVAGPQRIKRREQLQKIACVRHIAVRSEISRAVLYHPSCHEDFRIVIGTDAYPRISLRVFKQYIVFRLILLDKVVLEQQGIGFRIHYGILRISDFGNHYRRFARKTLFRDKILGYTLVEILGFTHINDIPLGVIISVDSGGMRK